MLIHKLFTWFVVLRIMKLMVNSLMSSSHMLDHSNVANCCSLVECCSFPKLAEYSPCQTFLLYCIPA